MMMEKIKMQDGREVKKTSVKSTADRAMIHERACEEHGNKCREATGRLIKKNDTAQQTHERSLA